MVNYLKFYAKNERPIDAERSLTLGQKVSDLLNRTLELYFNTKIEVKIESESCFYIILEPGVSLEKFKEQYQEKLTWLLSHNVFEPHLDGVSCFSDVSDFVLEVGPRLNFTTSYSTNAVSACRTAGIEGLQRIERSSRYRIVNIPRQDMLRLNRQELFDIFGDRMTEFEYVDPPNFTAVTEREDYFTVDIMGQEGEANLRKANDDLGLGFDEEDIRFYLKLFRKKFKRNPTDVELFDLGQSNSEHSRHWFFRGKLFVDGKEREENLMKSIKKTQDFSNKNNVIAFSDNSSAIRGFTTNNLQSNDPCSSSSFGLNKSLRHIIYTAETHNFPTGVSPFPGAATGTGGRIRDVHATGRGAHEIAGVAGYSVGNLYLDDYAMPLEDNEWKYPSNFAHPQKILIEASNGASDYGNKFGEPVICGFARTLGVRLPTNERFEYIKPIMFSGGVGSIDDSMIAKKACEKDQLIAKIGGPVYRIGLGGGAASSVHVQGSQKVEVDFGAVQRGDPEMEQKLHRLIRSCVELGPKNPILSIHDQGAGGNGNVLKEIVEGENGGAVIHSNKFTLGDPSISVRELWGAEYQESDAILLDPKLVDNIHKISKREKCQVDIVGEVTGNNQVILEDFNHKKDPFPVDMDLHELAERDPKEFHLTISPSLGSKLDIPKDLTIRAALEMVLRLPSVASKRYLTNKVDRSVTGLIAQQQCVGPLHTPVADVAVTALSYWDIVGAAVAVGEQPLKGMVDPEAGARMSLGEALTNLVFAPITSLKDVKCSGNWMWPAKLQGEGARLVQACDAMCKAMQKLGVAIDGGKDSLSMAAKVDDEVVKAPGTLVISAYAPCTDITKVVTPDLKSVHEKTVLMYLPMYGASLKTRLGGSALAQCLKQIGDTPADLDDADYFVKAFEHVQKWINDGLILAAHDVSDGGIAVAVLEMAFAGNVGLVANLKSDASDHISTLFAEELGVILQINEANAQKITTDAQKSGLVCTNIGDVTSETGNSAKVKLSINNEVLIEESLSHIREIWEETSDRLELLQTNPKCIAGLIEFRRRAKNIDYKADFTYGLAKPILENRSKVAVIREEGSNGDREMAAAFMMAGFEAYDITMTDLATTVDSLDAFNGLAFVGGFSYADVLGSAKGWASAIKHNERIFSIFERFRRRDDTFTFGVCNGCQLMALLNWTSDNSIGSEPDVFLDDNVCGRFHSGFTTVKIEKSPAIMLKGMENSVLGVWSSHGEGRFTYRTPQVLSQLKENDLVAVRYCDGEGLVAENYPENPNGSVEGVAGICSKDGRHLCLMPHPDRSFLSWQWPDYPKEWSSKSDLQGAPWIKMFENAYDWVIRRQPS